MIEKSAQYREEVKDSSRVWSTRITVDGEIKDLHVKNLTVNEVGVGGEAITIGGVFTNKLDMTLLYPNTNDVTEDSVITVELGLLVQDGVTSEDDYTSVGTFYVYELKKNTNENEWSLKAYDKTKQLNKTYVPGVSAPATVESVVQDIASQCSLGLEPTEYPNYSIETIPQDVDCKELLGYMAGLMGKNVRMSRTNKLEFYWYNNPPCLDITREGMQFMNGVTKDTQLTFSALISGVKDAVISSGVGKSITFYNPYMTQEILDILQNELLGSTGLEYTVLNCQWRGDPSLQVGDAVNVEDKDHTMLKALVTTNILKFSGGLQGEIKSQGKTDAQTSMKKPSDIKLEKLETTLTEAFKTTTETITGQNGGYYQTEFDEDGLPSGWVVMNTPTLRDDTHLWRMSMGGFGFSEDGGKTYGNLAFDLDGNFNANAITTGILQGNMFDLNLMTGAIRMGVRDGEGVISEPLFDLADNGQLTIKAVSDLAAEIALTMRVESEGVVIQGTSQTDPTAGLNSILLDGRVINFSFDGTTGTTIDIKGVDTHNITLDEVLYHKPILQTPYRTANGSGGIKFTWGGFD